MKRFSEKLPPLQIPGPGKRILQTDASDEYWAAALFEEIDGKRNICGYKFKYSHKYTHLEGNFVVYKLFDGVGFWIYYLRTV